MVASRAVPRLLPTGYATLSHGYTAAYTTTGQGEPLVIVPGLAGGMDILQPLVSSLRPHFRVTTFQLRGEERGLLERGFHLDQLVDDLADLIGTLRLERPKILGVSFGGAIALAYAARYPQRVSTLILQGAAERFRASLFTDVAQQVLNRFLLPPDNPFVNQFFRLLVGPGRVDPNPLRFIADCCWATDQSVMAHRLDLLEEYDLSGDLWQVRAPTLILGGDQDLLVTPGEARDLARRLPRGHFRKVRGGGHFCFVTHPKRLSAQIRRFDRAGQLAHP